MIACFVALAYKKEIISAWSPFYILTGFIIVWSLPFFKGLFTLGGPLNSTTLLFPIIFIKLMKREPPMILWIKMICVLFE
ncbi:L-lactate permease [Bacillus sp. 2205SS5-2]|uniref:L-lactate permease n=1 Tax=Bacillus sp. 2205SS5-2 TaxID=3109031 RepID=UPI003FA53633